MMKRFLICVAAALAATSASAQEFPVVFEDKAMLRELGVTLADIGPQPDVKPFAEKCYYYGDGGYSLSVSADLAAAYQAKGFSIGALCLGMVSGIRFHPTTGARLATFIVADVEAIRQYGPDPFAMSGEITLEVPVCFAGGKPMNDCDWRFDPMNGDALNDNGRGFVAKLAKQAEAAGAAAVASGRFDQICAGGADGFSDPCRIDKYPDTPENEYIKGRRAREGVQTAYDWPISFFDISPEFPGGYGYAIFADGAAGPSAQIDADKIALDPKKRASMAIIEGLKLKLK